MSTIQDPKEHLREVLTVAERHLRVIAELPSFTPERQRAHHVGLYLAWLSYAYVLDAWLKADPHAAQAARERLQELLDDGLNAGEWLWEQLEAHGVDPDKVDELQCCNDVVAEPTVSVVAVTQPAEEIKNG